MPQKPKVRTCLWFEDQAEEVAEFYVSVLPDSYIEAISRPNPGGKALVVEFRLAGAPYMTLNGGPQYKHTPAASISVLTRNQTETDRLWTQLLADGGAESMCGWLTDRFGVSWQIVPEIIPQMFVSDDKAAAQRAFKAMLTMRKLDIAKLEAAFRGEGSTEPL